MTDQATAGNYRMIAIRLGSTSLPCIGTISRLLEMVEHGMPNKPRRFAVASHPSIDRFDVIHPVCRRQRAHGLVHACALWNSTGSGYRHPISIFSVDE